MNRLLLVLLLSGCAGAVNTPAGAPITPAGTHSGLVARAQADTPGGTMSHLGGPACQWRYSFVHRIELYHIKTGKTYVAVVRAYRKGYRYSKFVNVRNHFRTGSILVYNKADFSNSITVGPKGFGQLEISVPTRDVAIELTDSAPPHGQGVGVAGPICLQE
ncbi:MAG: hypothetical protein JO104_02600 [Candidatus Eremiobacteraeota bacterium]|nr:hypothetical protein [Candidatus Eremiobacteraeota bacterium]